MVNYTFFLDSKLVVVDSEGRLTAAADDSIKLPHKSRTVTWPLTRGCIS